MELEFESPTANKIWKRASLFFQLLGLSILLAKVIDFCMPDRPDSKLPPYFFAVAGKRLAEEELSTLYQKTNHTPLDIQTVKVIWEKEELLHAPSEEVRYKLRMVFQNEQGQYFWFFYQNSSASLQEIDSSTVQLLTQGQHASAPLSHPSQLIEVKTWNLSK